MRSKVIVMLVFVLAGIFGLNNHAIAQSLNSGAIFGPLVRDNLAVYLVRGEASKLPPPMTLERAVATGAVRINEEATHPLTVENFSDTPVFIQFGELLVGGSQDQVAAVSTVVPPRSGRVPLETFCIDAFRFSAREGNEADSKTFSVSNNLLPLRLAKLAILTNAPNTKAVRLIRQLGVWWSIDTLRWQLSGQPGEELERRPESQLLDPVRTRVEQLLQARRSSSTDSLALTLETSLVAKTVTPYLDLLEPERISDDITGAVFAIGGTIVAAELYHSGDLFRQMLPRLLRAYATQAALAGHQAEEPPSVDTVRQFLESTQKDTSLGNPSGGGSRVGGSAPVVQAELADGNNWVYRTYIQRPNNDIEATAPESAILGILETGLIKGQAITGLTADDNIVLRESPSDRRWFATIQSPPGVHKDAGSALAAIFGAILMGAIFLGVNWVVMLVAKALVPCCRLAFASICALVRYKLPNSGHRMRRKSPLYGASEVPQSRLEVGFFDLIADVKMARTKSSLPIILPAYAIPSLHQRG